MGIGGLPGAGKSVLAQALGRHLGAVVLRSDAVRKDLAGVPHTTRLAPETYTMAASARVHAALWEQAAAALAAGRPVVLDAAHLSAAERARSAALAPRFCGLWLDIPPALAQARVAARVGDASDADAGVVALLAACDPGPIDWWRLDATHPQDTVLAHALAQVERG